MVIITKTQRLINRTAEFILNLHICYNKLGLFVHVRQSDLFFALQLFKCKSSLGSNGMYPFARNEIVYAKE